MPRLYKQKHSQNWFVDLPIWSHEKEAMVRYRASTKTSDRKTAEAFAEGLESASKAAKALAGKPITKAHAEAIVMNVLSIAGVEVETEKPLPFLKEWLEEFIKWRSTRVSEGSMRVYRGSHAKFLEWLKTLNLKTDPHLDWLTDKRVEQFYDWMRERLAYKTSNEHVKFIKRAMKRAVEKTTLLKNPVDGLELEKRGTTLERLPFSLDEAKSIYAYLLPKTPREREWARAVALSLMSGCRLEDSLTMEQESIKGGILTYRQKKTGKAITCPMVVPEWLAVIVETKEGPVCPELSREFKKNGTAKLSNEFTLLVSKAGIEQEYTNFKSGRTIAKKTFHSLRHTLRTAIVNSGGSDAQADVILGHSSGQGKRYTHREVDAMTETLKQVFTPSDAK